MAPSPAAAAAYDHCLAIARGHYENFPVASAILPRPLRGPVAAVYAFARRADDLADEGDLPAAERLAALAALGERLDRAAAGHPDDDPVFVALADAIARFALPPELFHDLLAAFAQDVTTQRYPDLATLLDYCRRSADPVGRLLLHLFGEATPQHLAWSDRICSALQLINFLQDLGQDYREMGRIYLPQEEMARFGVDEAAIAAGRPTPALRALLAFQVERARGMLSAGLPLGRSLRGRAGLEIRLIAYAGLAVCGRLAATAPFERPRLRKRDYLGILWRAALP